MKIALLALSLAFLTQAIASPVEFTGTPTNTLVSGLTIPIYPEASVKQLDDSSVKLKLSGHGVRKSSVVFLQVNVYHASSYVQDPSVLNLEDAMTGVKASPTRLLHLTALRNLSGDEVRTSLENALDYNGVDLTDPVNERLMNEISGLQVAPGDSFTFGCTPGILNQRIFFQLPHKAFDSEAPDISVHFWSVWFGKPFDSGLKDLKAALVGSH